MTFFELTDAVMWQALWECSKHRMPVLIQPSMTALNWMRKNLGFADLATNLDTGKMFLIEDYERATTRPD